MGPGRLSFLPSSSPSPPVIPFRSDSGESPVSSAFVGCRDVLGMLTRNPTLWILRSGSLSVPFRFTICCLDNEIPRTHPPSAPPRENDRERFPRTLSANITRINGGRNCRLKCFCAFLRIKICTVDIAPAHAVHSTGPRSPSTGPRSPSTGPRSSSDSSYHRRPTLTPPHFVTSLSFVTHAQEIKISRGEFNKINE